MDQLVGALMIDSFKQWGFQSGRNNYIIFIMNLIMSAVAEHAYYYAYYTELNFKTVITVCFVLMDTKSVLSFTNDDISGI